MALTRRGSPAPLASVFRQHHGQRGHRPLAARVLLGALSILGAAGCSALAIQAMGKTRAHWGDLIPVTSHAFMAASGAAAAVILAVTAVRNLLDRASRPTRKASRP